MIGSDGVYKIKMGKRNQQISFAATGAGRPQDAFGGMHLKSHPKSKRPLHSKLPIHLVLRSNASVLRLPKTIGVTSRIVDSVSKKYGVRVYRFANVGNHLHFVLKIPSVHLWAAFIRELTGRLAVALGDRLAASVDRPAAGNGSAASDLPTVNRTKFWSCRPFTRIVRGWRRAFQIIQRYVELNQWEAEGFISRREVKTLRDLRLIWAEGGTT